MIKEKLKEILESTKYKDFLKPVRSGMETFLLLDYASIAYYLRCTVKEVREAREELREEFPQTKWTNTWDKDSQVTVTEVVEYLLDKDPASFLSRGFYNEFRWNYYKIGRATRAQLKTVKAALEVMNWPLDPNPKSVSNQITKEHIKKYKSFLPKEYLTPGVLIALLRNDNIDIQSLELLYETLDLQYEETYK